jgi:hypothetical protein
MVARYRFRQKSPWESAIYASLTAAQPLTSAALNSPDLKACFGCEGLMLRSRASQKSATFVEPVTMAHFRSWIAIFAPYSIDILSEYYNEMRRLNLSTIITD